MTGGVQRCIGHRGGRRRLQQMVLRDSCWCVAAQGRSTFKKTKTALNGGRRGDGLVKQEPAGTGDRGARSASGRVEMGLGSKLMPGCTAEVGRPV
jgi:hypothetical protein